MINERIRKVIAHIKKKKEHFLFIFLIILSVLVVHNKLIFDSNKLYLEHDIMGYEYHTKNIYTNTISNYKEIPLWSNNVFGGTPFLAQPQVSFLPHIIFIDLLYSENISKSINYGMFINIILGGIFIYYALLRLRIKPKFAFISSLIFMFCGESMILTYSWFSRHATYQWTPLVFIFFYLAFNAKKGIKYVILDSILAGLFLAIMFMGGGLNYAMFMIFPLLTIPLVYLIGKNFKKRLIKTIIIGFVFSVFFLGMFAVKSFPMLEFGSVTTKESGFSLGDMIGQHLKIESIPTFFSIFVNKYLQKFQVGTNIGIIALILALFSLFKIKKRIVLNLWFIFILIFFVSIGFKPLLYIFWKYAPGLSKLHHVARAFYLLQFAVAVLAGIGATVFFSKIKKFVKNVNIKKLIYILIAVGIIVELGFIANVIERKNTSPSSWGRYDFNEQIEENNLMNHLSKEEGIFRINHFNHNMICGIVQNHVVHHEMEMLYGCYSLWIPEYFNVYLSVAYRDPAKFKGMLNTKYFFDSELINASSIKLLNKFEKCDICYQNSMDKDSIDGPYLYENEKYLPRAYFADNGILIAGEKDPVIQLTYGLMLDPNFNPVNTVIVMHFGSINDLEISELLRFKVIILTQGSINKESTYKLKQFVDNGGELYPNILNNENQINTERLQSTLKSFWKEYSEVKEADIIHYSANKRTIELNSEKGFLVLAEKFFMFEGWNPKINGKTKNIIRANGINSVVYLDGEKGNMKFKYAPKSFRNGAIITLLTLTIAISYFIYIRKSKKITNKNAYNTDKPE